MMQKKIIQWELLVILFDPGPGHDWRGALEKQRHGFIGPLGSRGESEQIQKVFEKYPLIKKEK